MSLHAAALADNIREQIKAMKYQVTLKYWANNVQIEVEADSEEEAMELAHDSREGKEIAADWLSNQVTDCKCLEEEREESE